ncbi:putative carboxypeptidase S-like 2 [Tetrabaena socialis]|uniref:Putative carboxypeptidase S-like 2 n=1 Tax=Tetrabaena socialis TaxID=47790 RepID=A0A2J7ZVU9_9CHLO|nr:putative carboxypeptidase S-like 2 [Tetrabaena socialis]|eukprot:PNH04403.1 putative carboxypeptidase S-like 2 [Tetrabaena socialis]
MPPTDGSDVQSQMWRLFGAMFVWPTPTRLRQPVTDMLQHLAPAAPAWMRPLLAHADASRSWMVNRLLGLAFRWLLGRDTAALVSHTVALTRLSGGVADNVLPQEALLSFNVRVLPGSGPEEVVAHLQRAARLGRVDAEVKLAEGPAWHGSDITSSSGRHFKLLRQAVLETWRDEGRGDVVVAPFMLMGGTDSKHYAPLSRGGVLRFVPYGMNKTAGDLGLIHSSNERIGIKYLARAVCTYTRMMQLFSVAEEKGAGMGAAA